MDRARQQLLAGLPVTERRLHLAGVSTAVLEGGDGPPVVLLHGPGEFAAKWLRVLPDLVTTHRVVAPDLPGHGSSDANGHELDGDRVSAWLGELIERTCPSPPVLMRQCSFDLDGLREQMGDRWEPFVAYNLELARGPGAKAAGRLMRKLGVPRIPPQDLARIAVPTTLIWGRRDRANRLRIAEAASTRFGWPLHVIEDCADDPPRDQPEAFLEALRTATERQTP